jgi:hypothetical protein
VEQLPAPSVGHSGVQRADSLSARLDAANSDQPCTVMFLRGWNYYVYPQTGLCCAYKFPVWKPDTYRQANATWAGRRWMKMPSPWSSPSSSSSAAAQPVLADWFRFQYRCDWLRNQSSPAGLDRLPGYLVQRDLFVLAGTNRPLLINETLTSGETWFGQDLQIGAQDVDRWFDGFLRNFTCLSVLSQPTLFRQRCAPYNAQGRLVHLGYG